MFQTPLLLLLITSTSLALSLSLESVLSPNFPRVATSLSRSLSVVVPPPPSPGLPPTTHATRATFPLHQKPTHNLLTHSSQPHPMDSDYCDECIFVAHLRPVLCRADFFKRLALIIPPSLPACLTRSQLRGGTSTITTSVPDTAAVSVHSAPGDDGPAASLGRPAQ